MPQKRMEEICIQYKANENGDTSMQWVEDNLYRKRIFPWWGMVRFGVVIVTMLVMCCAPVFGFGQEKKETKEASRFDADQQRWIDAHKSTGLNVGTIFFSESSMFFYYNGYAGTLFDTLAQFEEETGVPVHYHFVSTTEKLHQMLDEGKLDVICTGNANDYRAYAFSQAKVSAPYSLFTARDDIYTMEDLKGKTIALFSNNSLQQREFDKIFKESTAHFYASADQMIANTVQKKDDAFVMSDFYDEYALERDNIRKVNIDLMQESEFKFVGRRTPIELLDSVLADVDINRIQQYNQAKFNRKNIGMTRETSDWIDAKQTIKVGFFVFPPYQYVYRNKPFGLITQLTDEMHDKYGMNFEFVSGDFDFLFSELEKGNLDILPYAEIRDSALSVPKNQPQLKKNASFLPHEYVVYEIPLVFVYNADNPAIESEKFEPNQPISVGITRALAASVSKGYLELHQIRPKLYDNIFKMQQDLNQGMIDGYIVAQDTRQEGMTDRATKEQGVGLISYYFVADNKIKPANNILDVLYGQRSNLAFYEASDALSHYFSTYRYLYEVVVVQDKNYKLKTYGYAVMSLFFCGMLVIFFQYRWKMRYNKTEYLKNTDYMTSVGNRSAIEKTIGRLNEAKRSFYYGMLDIDFFKSINDTYGHGVGDEVIIFVADVLKNCCGSDQSEGELWRSQRRLYGEEHVNVGRLGGDEFVFIIQTQEEADVTKVLDAILAGTQQFVSRDGQHALAITVSIGVCLNKDGKDDFDCIYQAADAALYESKQAGRNRYTIDSAHK